MKEYYLVLSIKELKEMLKKAKKNPLSSKKAKKKGYSCSIFYYIEVKGYEGQLQEVKKC